MARCGTVCVRVGRDAGRSDRRRHDELQTPALLEWVDVGWGVRVKGSRLAQMADGFLTTDVPHMFKYA